MRTGEVSTLSARQGGICVSKRNEMADYAYNEKLAHTGVEESVRVKKKLLNIAFLVIVFALTLWSVLYGQDLDQLVTYLADYRMVFIIPSLICVLIFILGESAIFYVMFRAVGIEVRKMHCALFSFVGFFYCAITPSASGGQPMQLLAMHKVGIPAAIATVVLAVVTITYKMVLVILGAVVLIVRPAAVMAYLQPTMWLVYLGMALNVVFIVLLLFVVFRPSIVRRFAGWGLRTINRFRPFKDLPKQQQRVESFCSQYAGTSTFIATHGVLVLEVFAITFVQRWALFVVTWLTYAAFSLGYDYFMLITTLQGMISVSVDMLPLPGGMGVSENMFLVIFRDIFGPDKVLAGMVVSRGLSYYIQLLICAVMTVVASFVFKSEAKKRNIGAIV